LLKSAERPERAETPGAPASRRLALIAAAAAGLLTVGLYAGLGAPGLADQPYQVRLQRWRATDPSRLGPQEIAAVLQLLAKERPNDPEVFGFLGRAENASGDAYQASRAFARAAALRPRRADYQLMLGQSLLEVSQGKPSKDADMALSLAVSLNPKDPTARYILGREEIASGQTSDGVRLLRSVLDFLTPADPRRPVLQAMIGRALAGQPLDLAAPAAPSDAGLGSQAGSGLAAPPGDPAQTSSFIQAMVASLAARLKADPNDAEGWARLVRSYGVLHDKAGQARSLEAARQALQARPAELAPILAEARAHPA
jgi:cytochrome c-type biogenesis protein CcmH